MRKQLYAKVPVSPPKLTRKEQKVKKASEQVETYGTVGIFESEEPIFYETPVSFHQQTFSMIQHVITNKSADYQQVFSNITILTWETQLILPAEIYHPFYSAFNKN